VEHPEVDTLKKATTKDAEILLRLLDTMNTPQMRDSMMWFGKEFSAKNYKEFKAKYPVGSEGLGHVSTILGSFELAGVLVSHGLLNEDLYFDVSSIGFFWGSFEKIIPGWQKEAGPALWENAVWLAARQKKWKKEVWKPDLAWKLRK
jgi:hypothetical protein